MNTEDIKRRIETIKTVSDDPEAAHVLEDELYVKVLREISRRGGKQAALAREALRTQRLRFPRYYT